jgi:hypothetical protein
VSTEASIVLKLTFVKGKVIWMGEMTAYNHQITAVNTWLVDIFSIQTHKYWLVILRVQIFCIDCWSNWTSSQTA